MHERWYASDRPNRARVAGYCTDDRGKIGYLSRKDARRLIRKRTNLHGCNAYLCGYCGMWHIGHLPESVKAGNNDRAKLKAAQLAKAKLAAWVLERGQWDPLG